MLPKLRFLVVISAVTIASGQDAKAPTLQETFDWMTNTLHSGEGNNWYIHHPYRQPYPRDWTEKEINPYHEETITKFSHDGCQVKFVINTIDNDMGILLGKQLSGVETDTFNLKDIDPATIKVTNSREPFDTANGKQTPYNCEDDAGLEMEFKTRNAQPLIHRESVSSGYKSRYGEWQVKNDPKHSLDEMCKKMPGNIAYCDTDDVKQQPENLTSDNLVFHSPAYTKRFIEAFRHAIELCGGRASTF